MKLEKERKRAKEKTGGRTRKGGKRKREEVKKSRN